VRALLKPLLPRTLVEMHVADFSLATAAHAGGGGRGTSSLPAPPAPPAAAAAAAAVARRSSATALGASLPPRQRLLLVAAFVASHCPADQDRAKFTPKQQGRKRSKRGNDQGGLAGAVGGGGGGARAKLGPVAFDLERLLAIYGVFWGEYGGGSSGSGSSGSSSGGGGREAAAERAAWEEPGGDAEKWVEWQWHGGGDAGQSGLNGAAVLGQVASLVRSGLLQHVPATSSFSSSSSFSAHAAASGASSSSASGTADGASGAGGSGAASLWGEVDLGRARYMCAAGKPLAAELAAAFGLPLDRYLRGGP
jgi:hypothetical protein